MSSTEITQIRITKADRARFNLVQQWLILLNGGNHLRQEEAMSQIVDLAYSHYKEALEKTKTQP